MSGSAPDQSEKCADGILGKKPERTANPAQRTGLFVVKRGFSDPMLTPEPLSV